MEKKECKGSHDGKHRPMQKLGSSTGYICRCCSKEIVPESRQVMMENAESVDDGKKKRQEEQRIKKAHLEVFMGDKGDTML